MPVIALIMWSKTWSDNGKNNETIDDLTICEGLKKHSDGLHKSLNGYGINCSRYWRGDMPITFLKMREK